MERLWFSLLLLAVACRAQPCPKRCMCQSLSPSLAILCSKTGLLFVPAAIDRRTVELRLQENFITGNTALRLFYFIITEHHTGQNPFCLVFFFNCLLIIPFSLVFFYVCALNMFWKNFPPLRWHPAVRRKDFANMTSLLHLTLSRNTISQILPSAFSDLRRLRALHLDSNRLTVIKVRLMDHGVCTDPA